MIEAQIPDTDELNEFALTDPSAVVEAAEAITIEAAEATEIEADFDDLIDDIDSIPANEKEKTEEDTTAGKFGGPHDIVGFKT